MGWHSLGCESSYDMVRHNPGHRCLPSRPPPGLAIATRTEVVIQVVGLLGHVQAMLERFQELFERRLSKREAQVPSERSRSLLHDPSPSKARITDFSSEEESGPVAMVKVALVVCALSPGAAQADRHIVLDKRSGDIITIHLGVTESKPGLPVNLRRFSCGLGREVTFLQEET